MFWPIGSTLKYCLQHTRKVLREKEHALLPRWDEDVMAGAGAAVVSPKVRVTA